MNLKLLSWNIWYHGDFAKISKFLKKANADIVGLQEVVPDDPNLDVAGCLKDLGYYCALAPVMKIKDGRTMSNAVFSKHEIIGNDIYTLSDIDSRNAAHADIKVGEEILRVFSTHLKHTHQRPAEILNVQIENLINILPDDKTVVMGDFNALPESDVIQKMSETMVNVDTSSTPTLNASVWDCPGCDLSEISKTRLDYIFVSDDIKAGNFQIHNVDGSDHLPLTAEIKI